MAEYDNTNTTDAIRKNRNTGSDCRMETKNKTREAIAQHTEQYIEKGGEITICDSGWSNYVPRRDIVIIGDAKSEERTLAFAATRPDRKRFKHLTND